MRPVWLLVAAVAAVCVTGGAASQCLEHPSCQEVTSESSMLECIELCRSDLVADSPVIPSDPRLHPVAPSDPESLPPLQLLSSSSSSSSSSSPQAKRSYSMDHFRWGKPVGRKRSPFKVYATKGDVGEETGGLAGEKMPPEDKVQEVAEEEEEEEPLPGDVHEKKDGTYKMKHFRWSGPPASKRYGGFMKSWDERSQRPLFTLLKNVINKDGQEQKREQ